MLFAVMQVRSHEGLNQGSGGGDGDKLSNSEEIE